MVIIEIIHKQGAADAFDSMARDYTLYCYLVLLSADSETK